MFYFSFSCKDLYEISLNGYTIDVLFETTIIRMAEKNMRIFIPQFDSSFDEIISLVYLFYEEGAV